MSIGAFARRSRLSLKALRLYDSLGLLVPARVDGESGYRYYGEDQIERARLIGLLRQLEMPLVWIAQVLEQEGAEASRLVATYWLEVEADMRTRRNLARYLKNHLEGKEAAMYTVQVREVPEQKVLTVQRRVYAKELPAFIGEAFHKLYARLAQTNLQAGPGAFVIYHGEVNNDSDGPVEVCVAFNGSLEPEGEIRVRIEPAHQEAYTRITKAQVEFPGILGAFEAVHNWLKAQGNEMTDSPREVYFAPWDQLGPDDPACDIAFPWSNR